MVEGLEDSLVEAAQGSQPGITGPAREVRENDDIVDSDLPAQPAAGPETATPGLTEREERILAFERQWWRNAGAKEQAIADTFGLSATRYYQALNALLDTPAALAADPMLVGRLRRLRLTRARLRGC